VLMVFWISLLSVLLPLLPPSLSMFPSSWEGEKARDSAGVVDAPCCFSSCVWSSSGAARRHQHKGQRRKEEFDCEQPLPIFFCRVLRYPFLGPLGGQLSRTTQVTPEVTQAVHCGFPLSQRILFRRHSSHLSSSCQRQETLNGRR
jgi:hypothetical protein